MLVKSQRLNGAMPKALVSLNSIGGVLLANCVKPSVCVSLHVSVQLDVKQLYPPIQGVEEVLKFVHHSSDLTVLCSAS